MSHHGPRILFKPDADSLIGRGAVMYGGHFRPEMARILWAVSMAARRWRWDEIHVTEGHRNIRESRDMHKEMRAFDVTCREIEGDDSHRHTIYANWGAATASLLDDSDYQIIPHGDGANKHLHIELDP